MYNAVDLTLDSKGNKVEVKEIESQTQSEPLQKEMHNMLKTYETKSEARLNELCKTNDLLRKEAERLSVIRQELIHRVSFL